MSRRPLRSLLGVALATTCALALASCSTKAQVEDELVDSLKENLVNLGLKEPEPTVACPEDLKGGKGKTYDCEVSVAGVTFRVEVVFDDKTDFHAKITDHVLTATEAANVVERQLEADDGIETTVDCGEPLVVFRVDSVTTCSTEIDGEELPVEVQAKEDRSITAKVVREEPAP